MKSDNLFDTKFTFLDAVKILLLVVTMFSTWNIVDIMTPDGNWAWAREFAAVGMVEGAFLGFEAATAKAKSKKQVNFATWGFFCSLAVITLFAGASGLLEFGGAVLLSQPAGNAFGIAWTAKDVVTVSALVVFVLWIAVLAAIYRFYSLYDPDAVVELARIDAMGDVAREEVDALKDALGEAKPIVAAHRAQAKIQAAYGSELGQARTDEMLGQVRNRLNERYKAGTASEYHAPGSAAPAAPAAPAKESVWAGLKERVTGTGKADQGAAAYQPPMVEKPAPAPSLVGDPFTVVSKVNAEFEDGLNGRATKAIAVGDEIQVNEKSDGTFLLSEPGSKFAFSVVDRETLDYVWSGTRGGLFSYPVAEEVKEVELEPKAADVPLAELDDDTR